MKSARYLVVPVVAVASLLSLSACFGGGTPTPAPAHPNSIIDGDCIPGHWTNDIQTMAQEVADALPEGTQVVGVISSGTQTYDFTADHVTVVNDFSITITAQLKGGHLEEVSQVHHGTVNAGWTLDAHELTMTNVDNGDYTVSTSATVDGQGGSATTVPVPDADSSQFEAICRGNGMTIHPDGADDLVSHLSRVES